MKNLNTLVKKIFKPVAVLKYLFFPFMMAQSQGAVDFSKITGAVKIVAQAETETDIWAATSNGLYQINKTSGKFIHLTTQNSTLPSNNLTGVCANSNGYVFASTTSGIFCFDGSAYIIISTENADLPTNNFTSITCDEQDLLWLGTRDNGLVLMVGYKTMMFNKNNSPLTTNHVANVYTDENGVVVTRLADGNYVLTGAGKMQLFNFNESVSDVVAKTN